MEKSLQGYQQLLTRRRDLISFSLFLAALLIGCLQVTPPKNFGLGKESVAIAGNLAASGSFSNPFLALATGPTAVNPPLYPFFLAVLIKTFKFFPTVFRAAQLGCIVANAVTAALLPLISFLFLGEVVSGTAASVLWLFAMPMIPAWDASYTIAGLLFFCLFTASSIRTNKNPAGFGFLAGVLAGAIFLLNNSSLLVMGPWIAFQFLRERRRLVYLL